MQFPSTTSLLLATLTLGLGAQAAPSPAGTKTTTPHQYPRGSAPLAQRSQVPIGPSKPGASGTEVSYAFRAFAGTACQGAAAASTEVAKENIGTGGLSEIKGCWNYQNVGSIGQYPREGGETDGCDLWNFSEPNCNGAGYAMQSVKYTSSNGQCNDVTFASLAWVCQ